jgi:hypothetical protein
LVEHAEVMIAPATVNISSTVVRRETDHLQVQVVGFDNTRSASHLSFTFFDRNDRVIAPSPFRVAIANEFQSYFAASSLGGLFSLRAVFPITSRGSEIGAVQVEFSNSKGLSRTDKIRL